MWCWVEAKEGQRQIEKEVKGLHLRKCSTKVFVLDTYINDMRLFRTSYMPRDDGKDASHEKVTWVYCSGFGICVLSGIDSDSSVSEVQ